MAVILLSLNLFKLSHYNAIDIIPINFDLESSDTLEEVEDEEVEFVDLESHIYYSPYSVKIYNYNPLNIQILKGHTFKFIKPPRA